MDWMWTWGGESFGYRDGDDLWTHDGKHVGRFFGAEVYARDGTYLGELKNTNRLISNTRKAHQRQASFSPYTKRVGYVRYVNYVGYVMYAGHRDFPHPSSF